MGERGAGVRVAVVGAGVVGLTTATMLQEALPGASITVLADKFGQETTSDGAAGIFWPGHHIRGEEEGDQRRWSSLSYAYYKRILESGDAVEAGVKRFSGYLFSNKESVWEPFLKLIIDEYRECTPDELRLHGYKYGVFLTTLLTECRSYLPYLTRRITARGGRMERRHLKSLEELVGHYDIVCNCSGFGAKELCRDMNVTAIRGQVFKVKAPWLKNFYFVDGGTYIIPGIEFVTLGGTKNFDSNNAEVNKYDSQAIWERCVAVVPSLKDAEVRNGQGV
ncbi:D-aspartate oxidase-like isoform X2 [Eriocheir sinensis]|uniref:D-aspartate oxidase-like isoform X2 n=1 Tax=Eriocheir sinensis TaxID=95602 RepID=UPI0021C7CA35|nr:D-aspartate oxidase-like isoform X2 [Eriocheir sinensis]